MLGIVHHSPIVISVILDREFFKNELVSESDVQSGAWEQKIADFLSTPRSRRDLVLFIDKFSCLQTMLRAGLDTDPFKIVVFDTSDILCQIEGVDVVDAQLAGDTWALYELMPDKFNQYLRNTEEGVIPGIDTIDLSLLAPKTPEMPKRRARPVVDSKTANEPMAEANAVMQSILKDMKEDEPEAEEPPLEEDEDEEIEPPVDEMEDEETFDEPEQTADAPEPEPVKEPEPPKKQPKKTTKSEAKGEPKAKPKTPKKKTLEHYKLF